MLRPGSTASWPGSTPARRVRSTLAFKSSRTIVVVSRPGPILAHISGEPRIWPSTKPARDCAASFASDGSVVRPLKS